MLCIICHFILLKPLTLRMDHAYLLTSLPVSHAILPRAVCFATSRQANHAICCFIDSGGYASGPIRICLFIDYIIITLIMLDIFFLHAGSGFPLKLTHVRYTPYQPVGKMKKRTATRWQHINPLRHLMLK